MSSSQKISVAACIHPPTLPLHIMYIPTIFLFTLIVLSQQILAVIVVFTNNKQAPANVIAQMCNVESLLNACCVLLDIDIGDGRGSGWFHADTVALRQIYSPNSFTAVYSRSRQACFGEILDHRSGENDWQTSLLPGEGAGSALAVAGMTPGPMTYRAPDWLWIQGSEFDYSHETEPGVFLYEDAQGRVVRGRMVGDGAILRSLNSSRTGILSKADHLNITSMLAGVK